MTVSHTTDRHVVFLNRRDTSHPEGGGSEVFLERVAEQLHDLGWRVTVVCARYPGAPARHERGGITFVHMGEGLSLYARCAFSVLRQAFGRVDVFVDIQNGMPFCTPLVTRQPVVNLVHHVHREQWPVVLPPLQARFGWFMESRVAPWVYRNHPYVAVSGATRDDLVSLGVSRASITIVRNGTDVHLMPGTACADRPTVLAVSRLVPHKRLDIAIRSLTALRRRVPDVLLVIAGSGYAETDLRRLARDLDVEGHVDFRGWVEEEHKHRLMAQAWVMAAPSRKEGWGLSVIEAAAHGTPSVAFRCAGGLTESIVDGQTGLLVDGGVPEYAAALERLLVDHELRRALGTAAVAHATGFSWAATGKSLHTVLDDACASHGRYRRRQAQCH